MGEGKYVDALSGPLNRDSCRSVELKMAYSGLKTLTLRRPKQHAFFLLTNSLLQCKTKDSVSYFLLIVYAQ